jgi:hypothetical protein
MTQDKYEARLLTYLRTCKSFDKVSNGSTYPFIAFHQDGAYHSTRCKRTMKALQREGKIFLHTKDQLWRAR